MDKDLHIRKSKSIHFVGIKGVGMTPLAVLAKEAGFKVTGSDIGDDFITTEILQKTGIETFDGFSADHVAGSDLVIATGAHGGLGNVEAQAARTMKIPLLTQGEAVGAFMRGKMFGREFEGISVAGTHGKTTTSAMLATILAFTGHDPSYVVGTGFIPSLGAPGHYGKGKFFVAEADEYATDPGKDNKTKFLWQHPMIEIITGIEMDHPDIYSSLQDMTNAFAAFTKNLPADGVLVANGDDPEVNKILNVFPGRKITYGFSPKNNFYIEKVTVSEDNTFFWPKSGEMLLGEFSISVGGQHNAANALACIATSLEAGISIEKIKFALTKFKGTKRRSEFVGKTSTGALIYDDYAHHPTEIKATLASFKKRYPQKKVVCIFQPHTYSRTKSLFAEFSTAFSDASEVILVDIYASQREEKDDTVSSRSLVEEINKNGKKATYVPNLSDVVEYLASKDYSGDYIILTMGAGDVYKINQKLNIKNQK